MLFLCEDNGLAVHSFKNARQSYNLLEHAKTFGIECRRVDEGWDMLAIRQATLDALAVVRTGRPFVLEIATGRYKEHVGVGDDFHFGYRSAAEIDRWKARDPLLLDEKLVAELKPEIDREIAAAAEFAENSPFPGRDELLTDII